MPGAVQRLLKESKPAEKPKVCVVTPKFGASEQPWMWRQIVGFQSFNAAVLCWERCFNDSYPSREISVRVVPRGVDAYNGGARWLHRFRNITSGNFYAATASDNVCIEDWVKRESPVAILCYFGEIAMRLCHVAQKFKIPLIAYFHGEFDFLTNRWYRWSLLRCIDKFASTVVVTTAEKKWLMAHGLAGSKIHELPCGVPTNLFKPCSTKSGKIVRFVMVSRLVEEKGCSFSIRAFAGVANDINEVELTVFGDGPLRDSLKTLVNELNISKKVVFRGCISESSLAKELPDFDVFIQHSIGKEGSPVAIAEAMGCGLPVVATPVGGIVRQVVNGKTGYLVQERNIEEMSEVMSKLVVDCDLRRRMGLAGRGNAVRMYDSTNLTRRLEEIVLKASQD